MRLANFLIILMALAIGLAIGISGFTFVYAKGAAYLSDDPAACANCHIMQEQYDGWLRSSHRNAAGCNDCHTPKSFIPKYWNKSANGLRHSWKFTTGSFHEPIAIKASNRAVTENRCRDCHEAVSEAIDTRHPSGSAIECTRCHGAVGHP